MSDFLCSVQQAVCESAVKCGILTKLPNCERLCNMKKLSIKLESNEQRDAAIMQHELNQEFAPVNFLIRNEESGKETVMNAEVICNEGFCVQQQGSGRDVMIVTLANQPSNSIGELVHPSGATIFKVLSDGERSYCVQKAASAVGNAHPPFIRIEKVLVPLYLLAKMMGFNSASCVYRFKDRDGRVLGYVRPKLFFRKNTLIVKFKNGRGNSQVRGAMLGAALLFVLLKGDPEVGNLLL
uniref:Uncharacterized protein n=1 Tax=Plectus sambesii TaxID=2011161 RepID=A0A914XDX7_9BILA